jgi:hypothetical protein
MNHPRFQYINVYRRLRVPESKSREMPTEFKLCGRGDQSSGQTNTRDPVKSDALTRTIGSHRDDRNAAHYLPLDRIGVRKRPNQRFRGSFFGKEMSSIKRGKTTKQPTNLRIDGRQGDGGTAGGSRGGEVAGGAGAIAPRLRRAGWGWGAWWTRKTSTATWGRDYMWRIFYSPPISVAHPCHMLVLDSLAVAMEGGRGGAGRQVASGAVRRPWRGRAWVCPRIGLVIIIEGESDKQEEMATNRGEIDA